MNYRRACEMELTRVARMLDRPLATSWPFAPGSLLLHNESGVKRVRVIPDDGAGESDLSPACTSWAEVYMYLRGMGEALDLAGVRPEQGRRP